MDAKIQIELEAAAFRQLIMHLKAQTEVQNIDLMNLAGFCRNCLAKWYMAAAQAQGVPMDYDVARDYIYGMPYADWKEQFHQQATAEQLAIFEGEKKRNTTKNDA